MENQPLHNFVLWLLEVIDKTMYVEENFTNSSLFRTTTAEDVMHAINLGFNTFVLEQVGKLPRRAPARTELIDRLELWKHFVLDNCRSNFDIYTKASNRSGILICTLGLEETFKRIFRSIMVALELVQRRDVEVI